MFIDTDYGYIEILSKLPSIRSKKVDLEISGRNDESVIRRSLSITNTFKTSTSRDPKALVDSYFHLEPTSASFDFSDQRHNRVVKILEKANKMLKPMNSFEFGQ